MNSGKAAAALTGGYLLGRMHKARWALALAGAVAGKRLRARGGELGGALTDSPEISKLTAGMRGELAAAGRAAAMAVASRQIDALSGRMANWSANLRGAPGGGPGEKPAGGEDEEHADDEEQAAGKQAEGASAPSRRGGTARETARGGAGDRPKARRTQAPDRGPAGKAKGAEGAKKRAASGGGTTRRSGTTARSGGKAASGTGSGQRSGSSHGARGSGERAGRAGQDHQDDQERTQRRTRTSRTDKGS
jgi:hypothetical protein